MKLRFIHSCMVLAVLCLLLFYSAFLTSPSFTSSDDSFNSLSNVVDNESISHQTSAREVPDSLLTDKEALEVIAKNLQLFKQEPSAEQSPEIGRETKRDVGSGAEETLIPTTLEMEGQKIKIKKSPYANKGKYSAIRTGDIYEGGFVYSNPGLCPNEGEDLRLFIMIMSAPSHFSARDAIRLTWAHYAQRMDISIAFLIGKTENETVLEGLEGEKAVYDDLIVANFQDSYDNLTLKTMSTLEWMDTYCNQSQFILKTDDDMFINVPNLLNFIKKIEDGDAKEPKIYGRLAKKWKPVRSKKSKYYISFQQYKKTVYPDFTTGPAYLFSTRIARGLFEKGMERTYLKLEDVFTTGLLAQELKIKRVNIGDFANKKVNFHKTGYCALSRLISMHMVAFHEQFELWRKLLDGRTKCKIIYTSPSSPKPLLLAANKSSNKSSNGSSLGTGTSSNPNTGEKK